MSNEKILVKKRDIVLSIACAVLFCGLIYQGLFIMYSDKKVSLSK